MKPDRLSQLQQFLEQDPNDPFVKYGIAMEYTGSGKFEEALKWFDRIKTDHPDYLPLYYQYGMTLIQTGDEEEAEEVLRAGIELAKQKEDRKTQNELAELLDDIIDEDEY